jgi:hypothetical protein
VTREAEAKTKALEEEADAKEKEREAAKAKEQQQPQAAAQQGSSNKPAGQQGGIKEAITVPGETAASAGTGTGGTAPKADPAAQHKAAPGGAAAAGTAAKPT